MHQLRPLVLLLFAAMCFQGFALDSKPVVLNPTTGNFRNIPTGDRLTLPDASGDLVTIDVGVQAAARVVSLPILAGSSVYAVSTGALTSGRVPYITTDGLLADTAKLLYSDTLPTLTLGAGASNSPFLVLNKGNTGGQVCYVKFQAQGNDNIIVRTSGNNTGSDAGGNFGIDAYTDGSVFIDTPFSFTRQTGGTVTVGSAARVVSLPGTTSATSSIAGAVTIGNGVAATSVAIGGGNINAGGTTASTTTGTGAVILSGSGAGLGVNGQVTAARLTAIETTSNKNMHNVNSSALAAGAGKSSTLWLDFVSSGFGAGDRAAGMSAVIEADNTNLLIEYNYFNGSTYNTWSRFTGSTGVYALTGTTDSTSTTTGAVIVSGGAGFAKQVSARNYLATGGTITANQPVFDATQTWNNGGVTFTGIKSNITDTASNLASLHLDLQTGGTSRFNVNKSGNVLITQAATSGLTAGQVTALGVTAGAHTTVAASAEVQDVTLGLARTIQWATGAVVTQRSVVITSPTISFVGASTVTNAATVAITAAPTAGTNATLTNAWALWIQAGTTRFDGDISLTQKQTIAPASAMTPLTLTGPTIATALPVLNMTSTWSAGGVAFTAIKLDVSDGASAAGSLLADLQVTSTSKFSVRKDGLITTSSAVLMASSVALTNGAGAGAGTITNAPAAGNPTKWIPISDNGTTRYIPAW